MPAPDGGDDFVGIGDPLEGLGVGVVIVEEAVDRGLEVGDGSEDAALETALGQDGEEALDSVEPGGRGRGEVERPARVARQPSPHGGMLVGGVIVDDRVDRLAGRNLALDGVEEADELLMAGSSFGMREGRVLSRRSPSTPSAAKRSCQRQTQVLDLPVARMIAFVPRPSALRSTICARHTCFCGALRSLTRLRSRSMSAWVTEKETPVRIPQTRTPRVRGESPKGIRMSDAIH